MAVWMVIIQELPARRKDIRACCATRHPLDPVPRLLFLSHEMVKFENSNYSIAGASEDPVALAAFSLASWIAPHGKTTLKEC